MAATLSGCADCIEKGASAERGLWACVDDDKLKPQSWLSTKAFMGRFHERIGDVSGAQWAAIRVLVELPNMISRA